ncbi:glucose dehydrogenase [Microbacterium invictum]|uniref:Glucose dehydrogenase n=1 Tax=Microbacterium invictum TaxID=515415 RepID=A0AA40VNB9_9MICO|nr:glucose dehydrogenase [Microbacterium invictum]
MTHNDPAGTRFVLDRRFGSERVTRTPEPSMAWARLPA